MKEKIRDVRILAITEEGYDAGFKLAGCITRKVKDERELTKLLEKIIEDESYGIVLVEESLYRKIDEKRRKKFDESSFPLIISLSLKTQEKISPEEYLRELTRRTIGYSLRIK